MFGYRWAIQVLPVGFAAALAIIALPAAGSWADAPRMLSAMDSRDDGSELDGGTLPDQGELRPDEDAPSEDGTVPTPRLPDQDEAPGCPFRGRQLELIV